jgi:hypothetical protein
VSSFPAEIGAAAATSTLSDEPARRKRVLLVDYSQTGQLRELATHLVAPLLADTSIELQVLRLVPRRAYPYPWPFWRFLDAFPESAHLVAPELEPLALSGDEDFDLVILPWQVWFLAPSQPITAFLRDPLAQRVLRGKPVVSVIACRNMWLLAHDKFTRLLADCGARLIDNVVYTDPGPALATFITTPRWLLTGRRGALWGMPAAGLNQAQITGAARFGRALRDALQAGRERDSAPLLAGLDAVAVDPRLYISEKVGTRSFYLWGKLLRAAGPPGAPQRVPLLAVYAVFLVTMIVTVVPVSLLLQRLTRPFAQGWLNRIRHHYELPSGSARDRLGDYDL